MTDWTQSRTVPCSSYCATVVKRSILDTANTVSTTRHESTARHDLLDFDRADLVKAEQPVTAGLDLFEPA